MDQAWAKSSLLFSGVYTKEDGLESDWMKKFFCQNSRISYKPSLQADSLTYLSFGAFGG